jgi:putative endonuclease
MQFWVYILRCRDGSYYTGHTDDLEKRLYQHRQGKMCDWTRRQLPVELVWCDWTGTRYEALEFERRVKNWSRAKKEALIAGDWARLGYFAKPPHERPSVSDPLEKAGPASPPRGRPSTTLGTNELFDRHKGSLQECNAPRSFVPSEVESRSTSTRPGREGGK